MDNFITRASLLPWLCFN